MTSWSIRTSRLIIRRAAPTDKDISLLVELWNSPEVMHNVGFPDGLRIDAERVRRQLSKETAGEEYDCVLMVDLADTGEVIGQCELGSPDEAGIAHTDVKLMPAHWGNGYGVEIKRTLVDYLFTHTDCSRVQATPNVNNRASIRMQEAVGGRRTGEGVHHFPESMKDYTTDVHYMEYTVFREDWSG